MSAAQTQPESHPPSTQREDERQKRIAVLDNMTDLGSKLAHAVYQQAMAYVAALAQDRIMPNAPPPADVTIPFDRVVRCVRRTIALAEKIAEPPKPSPEPRYWPPNDNRPRRERPPRDPDAEPREQAERADTPELAETYEFGSEESGKSIVQEYVDIMREQVDAEDPDHPVSRADKEVVEYWMRKELARHAAQTGVDPPDG